VLLGNVALLFSEPSHYRPTFAMVDVSLQGDDYPLTDDENAYPERPACLCTLSVRGVSFVGDDVWGLKKEAWPFA
jgi:hypothetical protein